MVCSRAEDEEFFTFDTMEDYEGYSFILDYVCRPQILDGETYDGNN